MNNVKVNDVVGTYRTILQSVGSVPVRNHPDRPLPVVEMTEGPDRYEVAINHAHWMCLEILAMPAEKLEKKMRWLGFIQGVFWMAGVRTVEESRRDNMPEAEKALKVNGRSGAPMTDTHPGDRPTGPREESPLLTDERKRTATRMVCHLISLACGIEAANFWAWERTPMPVGWPSDEQLLDGLKMAASGSGRGPWSMPEGAERAGESPK
jgi:hypothetical protein